MVREWLASEHEKPSKENVVSARVFLVVVPLKLLAQMFYVALVSIFFLLVITLFARASATCGNSVLSASFGDLFSPKPQAVQ